MKANTRILIVGAGGQLGQTFRQALSNQEKVVFKSSADLDVLDADKFESVVKTLQPEAVINCSGYTAVDTAEAEKEQAFELNARAPEMMARIAARHDARLVHFSTDYVFDGMGNKPYVESDQAQPINVYGASKLEGEERILALKEAHLIFRVSWLYSPFGKNFFKTMLRLSSEGTSLKVVNDQMASPTYAGDLVQAVLHLLRVNQKVPGLYHFTNSGLASWFDFADEIIKPVRPEIDISAVQTGYFKTAAKRPRYSKLDTSKYTSVSGFTPRNWKAALAECRAFYLQTIAE